MYARKTKQNKNIKLVRIHQILCSPIQYDTGNIMRYSLKSSKASSEAWPAYRGSKASSKKL